MNKINLMIKLLETLLRWSLAQWKSRFWGNPSVKLQEWPRSSAKVNITVLVVMLAAVIYKGSNRVSEGITDVLSFCVWLNGFTKSSECNNWGSSCVQAGPSLLKWIRPIC